MEEREKIFWVVIFVMVIAISFFRFRYAAENLVSAYAGTTGSGEVCSLIEDSQRKAECFTASAIETNDLSKCASVNIDNWGLGMSGADYCYREFAKAKSSCDSCGKISIYLLRYGCYKELSCTLPPIDTVTDPFEKMARLQIYPGEDTRTAESSAEASRGAFGIS